MPARSDPDVAVLDDDVAGGARVPCFEVPIFFTTVFVAGSIRETEASILVTHTAPLPTAMLRDPLIRIVAMTAFVCGSILDTDLLRVLITHTAPSPTAMAVGTSPTGIVTTIWLVAGLIRDTEFSPGFVTHTALSTEAIRMALWLSGWW